ncbi:DUF951 domain-containing protein [Companilactobacillus sp.]|jgi:hypothetical protein|uniref:DUF951 domain-containing protein n=1 Tax=Companilactobacillus sp. TaxID=2767905 RepID=UPI0025B8FA03|nr:DUF951 domain-containing protein [Companilactobacillus sp.]MCH4009332.1 DUF951 domain-containing protein [Companilactobacillus sp.]MCH4050489.1 DUF951 domain-containing protein [Companilactobacillus sp.]MCH4077274.1 DUF951 domain-containing protein [Companilactobacillus sp.]MCH4125850.1 DUF951 domain-containing protein [Companilactobacillus sp.]MCI1311559.1 DUF951 domain-containing protein [Companilactobacillus sp.]
MFNLGDIVTMKKPHACGENRWEVIRLGADIKIKCMGCGHIVMIPRAEFKKKFKKVLVAAADVDTSTETNYLMQNQIMKPNTINNEEDL